MSLCSGSCFLRGTVPGGFDNASLRGLFDLNFLRLYHANGLVSENQVNGERHALAHGQRSVKDIFGLLDD